MAQKLKFPIGFDLKSGVNEAAAAWKNTYRKQLQDKINKHPIKVKLAFDANDENLKYIKQIIKQSRDLEAVRQSALKTQREEIALMRDKEKLAKDIASKEKEEANATIARAKSEQAAAQETARTKKMEADAINAKNRALKQTTNAYRKHDGLLKRMAKKAVVLFGAHQIMTFLRRVKDVTAEVELQKASLGALIGNMQKASELYAQIKDAAIKSPFKISELVKYTRQLAAYKISTDELFDTTMRLADISAGLGVSMDRVILAYGQIRATGYLRATEVRQLTEAGIPIVESLAEKLTAMNGQLTTAGEVMELISKRAISFELVRDVFADMTNAGGMFYKMQEKQSETLYGMWENLKDAATIMYTEIGSSARPHKAMEGMMKVSAVLLDHWQAIGSVVKSVFYGYIAYKAVIPVLRVIWLTIKKTTLMLNIAKKAAIAFGKALGKAMLSMLPLAAISAVLTMLDELHKSSVEEAEALDKANKAWNERHQRLVAIADAYKDIKAAEEQASEQDEAFAKEIYGRKLEALMKLSKELENYGVKNAINFDFIDSENIDEVFTNWEQRVRDAESLGRAFSGSVATLNSAFEGTFLGWSIFGENLKSDMDDLARSWNNLTLNPDFTHELERMKTTVTEFKGSEDEEYRTLYSNLKTALGMEIDLALAQKKRNESEYQYQMRIIKNYMIIQSHLEAYYSRKKKFLDVDRLAYKDFLTEREDFSGSLDEVMHELSKYKTAWMDEDAFKVKMAIDITAAENEWYDWQKEAIIEMINKDRAEMELDLIIPTADNASNAVLTGYKARLMSEFKGLFTEDELSKMVSVSAIQKALADKLKDAKQAYANALSVVSNPEIKGSTLDAYLKEIERLTKKIEDEKDKDASIRDEGLIKKLQQQRLEYENIHDQIKKNADVYKTMTKAAYEQAKAAQDTFFQSNQTAMAKDVKSQFPDLFASSAAEIGGSQFSFQITDEELDKANTVAKIYDLWAAKMQDVNKQLEEYSKWGMTEETLAAEENRINQERQNHEERLALIEEELQAEDENENRLVEMYQTYLALQKQLNAETDPKKRANIERYINNFLQEGNLQRYIALKLEQQKLQEAVSNLNVAAATNNEIKDYLKALGAASDTLKTMGKRYNFTLPGKGRRGGSKEDEWIKLLRNRMKFMQDFNKGYEEFAKKMQNTDALLQEQTIMLGRGAQLGIDANSLKNPKQDLLKWYQDTIKGVSDKIASLGGKQWSGLGIEAILVKSTDKLSAAKAEIIKKYQQFLADLWAEMTKFQTDDAIAQLEKKLKEVSDKVAKTKTAKEFFDKMFSLSGNREYSMNLTMSLYGVEGDESSLNKALQEHAKELFKGINIDDAFEADGSINYKKLKDYLPKLEKDDERTKAAEQFVDEGIKGEAKWLETIEKMYQRVFSFEERRTQIHTREAANRAKIEAKVTDKNRAKQLTDASLALEERDIAKINLEELKNSEDWVMVFENIDRVGTKSITHLMSVLDQFIKLNKDRLEPTELKTLMTEYNKLYEAAITRNPYKAMANGLKEYFVALHNVTQARVERGDAKEELKAAESNYITAFNDAENAKGTENEHDANDRLAEATVRLMKAKDKLAKVNAKVRKSQNAQVASLNKVKKGVNDSINAFNAMGDIASTIQETFNVDEASDFGVALKSVGQALTMVAGVLGVINAMITLIETHPLVLAISAAIMAIIGGIMLFNNLKTRDAELKIESLERKVENLEYAYERLEKAQEKAFGSDYINNYQQRIANLEAQQQAYLDMAEAERSKGKKADEEKIREYEKQARDTADAILDMESELSEHFMGTDVASAARDFAEAWMEAYKEFGNTADAMTEKFSEMINNMIVESFAAKVMESALQPIFDDLEKMMKDGSLDLTEAATVADMAKGAVVNMDVGMSNLMAALEAAGISVRGMGGDLTGISRDIASASEESILGLAAGINTQNYYISQVPAKMDEIIFILRGGGLADSSSAITLQDLVTLQNQHLAYLPNIAQNTADTVARCERAAIACERVADNLDRVIKPRGVQSTYTMNTTIN